MRILSIAFSKDNYVLAIGVDDKSVVELNRLLQYSDKVDVDGSGISVYYFYDDNVNQTFVFREATQIMNEHFLSIIK